MGNGGGVGGGVGGDGCGWGLAQTEIREGERMPFIRFRAALRKRQNHLNSQL